MREPVRKFTLPYKSYARIVCRTEEEQQKIYLILSNMDSEEFNNYYPTGLVTVRQDADNIELTYTGKYDLDLNKFQLECWKQNIPIMILQQGRDTDGM
jgi:hypothetical protein